MKTLDVSDQTTKTWAPLFTITDNSIVLKCTRDELDRLVTTIQHEVKRVTENVLWSPGSDTIDFAVSCDSLLHAADAHAKQSISRFESNNWTVVSVRVVLAAVKKVTQA